MSKAAFTSRKLETAPFDTRVVARQLSSGLISHKDLAKHLKGVEDSSDNAETITVTLAEEEEEEVADDAETAEDGDTANDEAEAEEEAVTEA